MTVLDSHVGPLRTPIVAADEPSIAPAQAAVFSTDRWGAYAIGLLGSDGTTQQITSGSDDDYFPKVAPGGELVSFLRATAGLHNGVGGDVHPDLELASRLHVTRPDGTMLTEFAAPGTWLAQATPHFDDLGARVCVTIVDGIVGAAVAIIERGQLFDGSPTVNVIADAATYSDASFVPTSEWSDPDQPEMLACSGGDVYRLASNAGVSAWDSAVAIATAPPGSTYFDPKHDPTGGTAFTALRYDGVDFSTVYFSAPDATPVVLTPTGGGFFSEGEFDYTGQFVVTHHSIDADTVNIVRVPIDGSQTVETLLATGDFNEYACPIDPRAAGSRWGLVRTETRNGVNVTYRETPGIDRSDDAPGLDDVGGQTIDTPDTTWTNKRFTGRQTIHPDTAGGVTTFINCLFDFADDWSILRNGGSGPVVTINCTFRARPNPQTGDSYIAWDVDGIPDGATPGDFGFDDGMEGGGDDILFVGGTIRNLYATPGTHVDGIQYGTPTETVSPTVIYNRAIVEHCDIDPRDIGGLGAMDSSLLLDGGCPNPLDGDYTNTTFGDCTIRKTIFRPGGAISVRLGAFADDAVVAIDGNRWHDYDGTWDGSTPLQNASGGCGGATFTDLGATWSDNIKALTTTVAQPD